MRIGVPTEIKTDEYRVALTPAGVRELTARGHEVLVQAGAGEGSAIADAEYVAQGAEIVADAEAVFAGAETIVKVKEPQASEVARLEPHHTLFTYLHLAPDPELTRGLVASGATCIAYETVTDRAGRLPLLAPMSEVAGKIATQAGAFMLERPLGGRGVLLGGVPGVAAGVV
ncbi:MAG TPA: alanine dehydrogenase, partial [Solirubrobacterales bacterium]|nr:alanine dehydrogenase [Solirubrobacterales bacterium]